MTDIEALLSVDRGQVPPATVAFFARDEESFERRRYATVAALTGVAAACCAACGGERMLVALMVLVAAVSAVLATPTIRDGGEPARPCKPHVMVVTAQALVVRDGWGLRSWRFEDLADVVLSSYNFRPCLVLVQRDGSRHALDYLSFQRGERLREVINHHLSSPAT
jgi:hypothetical protein